MRLVEDRPEKGADAGEDDEDRPDRPPIETEQEDPSDGQQRETRDERASDGSGESRAALAITPPGRVKSPEGRDEQEESPPVCQLKAEQPLNQKDRPENDKHEPDEPASIAAVALPVRSRERPWFG